MAPPANKKETTETTADSTLKKETKATKSKSVVKGKKGRKKASYDSYATFIYKVLKQVHPDAKISKTSMTIMNNFVVDTFHRIATEAKLLASKDKSKTLAPRDFESAVRLVLPGELSIHAGKEGVKAVTRYTSQAKSKASK